MKNPMVPSLAGRPRPVQIAWGLFLLLAGNWLVLAGIYWRSPGLADLAYFVVTGLTLAFLGLTRSHYGLRRRTA